MLGKRLDLNWTLRVFILQSAANAMAEYFIPPVTVYDFYECNVLNTFDSFINLLISNCSFNDIIRTKLRSEKMTMM